MSYIAYLATALGAYLIGSIPTGFLIAKAKGIDIRKTGSGNIGATNAMRVLGKPAGIFVLLADCTKGYVACAFLPQRIYNWLAPHFSGLYVPLEKVPSDEQMKLFVLAGICAVLGHNFTCWLKFKGGKGIATTAGVYLALAPWAVLAALIVFILAVLLTRYVSVGSITAAIALPAAVWILQPHNVLLGSVTIALGAMAVYKHKSNIQRLMAGTETRLGKKSAEGAK